MHKQYTAVLNREQLFITVLHFSEGSCINCFNHCVGINLGSNGWHRAVGRAGGCSIVRCQITRTLRLFLGENSAVAPLDSSMLPSGGRTA